MLADENIQLQAQNGNLLLGRALRSELAAVCASFTPLRKAKQWIYTVLLTFVGSDRAQPDANVILDSKGNLYGTTITVGPGGYGVAFEVIP
jgi:hypothetical protein